MNNRALRHALDGLVRATLMLTTTIALVACGGPQSAAQPARGTQSQTVARIDAQPNPVPGGSGLGTTRIAWSTGDGSQGQVYVSQDGGPEHLFDAGTDGSKDAPWIQAGPTYEFRLYSGSDHKTQLGSVTVTRAT